MNILETASNSAEPPKSGAIRAWVYGVGAAVPLCLCGVYCLIARHGRFINLRFRGLPGDRTGLICEVSGRQAMALGLVLIALGMFANVHWFWPRFEGLSRYYEIAKAACLVAIIAAVSWWIYESM